MPDPTESEHLVPAEAGGSTDSEPMARPEVVAFLCGVGQTLGAVRLYEVSHPLVHERALYAASAREAIPDESLRLGVGPGTMYDGRAVIAGPPEIVALADLLHRQDLGWLVVGRGLQAESLLAAVELWLGPTGSDAESCCAALKERTGGAMTAEPVDFARVRTSERRGRGGTRWTWGELLNDLLAGPSGDAESATPGCGVEGLMDDAAAWISEQTAADPEVALHALHATLHGVLSREVSPGAAESAEVSQAASDEGRLEATLERLAALLERLAPVLREALSQGLPGSASSDSSHDRSRSQAGTLAEAMPAIVLAVSGMGAEPGGAAHASLRMCEKLARLTERCNDVSFDAEPGSAPSDSRGTAHGLRNQVQALVDEHDPTEFTPPDYQERLETLSRETQSGPAASPEILAAFSAEAVGDHALNLALHLSLDAQEASGPESWAYLTRRLPGLVEAARVPQIARLARGADARRMRGGPEEVLEACRSWLDLLREQLGEPGRLNAMLATTRDAEDVATLLQHADASVLQGAVERVADAETDELAEPVARPLRNLGAAILNPLAEALITTSPARRVPLVRRLGPMAFATATAWLGALLTEPDEAARREAFAALESVCPVWPAESIAELLEHPDEPVRSAAMGRLLRQRDAASLSVQGDWLMRTAKARSANPALIDRLVGSLLEAGRPGHEVLVRVLGASESGWLRKRRADAGPVAAAIRWHADPELAEALLDRRAWTEGAAA